MAEAPDYSVGFRKIALAAFAAYGLGLVALLLPAETVVVQGTDYSMALWYQHSGKVAAVVLLLMGSLQGLWWKHKKQWIFWPGVTAGIYTAAFSLMRMLNLYSQTNRASGYQEISETSAYPQMGLLLLLAAGIGLLIQMWLLYKIRPASNIRR